MPLPQLSLKGQALRALAARELTRVELQSKLKAAAKGDQPAEAIPELLDELQAKGYLSDERAAQALSRRRSPKLGTQRVVQELRQRGTDPDAVAQVADELRSTELSRAQAVWQKKFGALAANPAERGKQMRFLASRGFGGAVIGQVLRGSGLPSED